RRLSNKTTPPLSRRPTSSSRRTTLPIPFLPPCNPLSTAFPLSQAEHAVFKIIIEYRQEEDPQTRAYRQDCRRQSQKQGSTANIFKKTHEMQGSEAPQGHRCSRQVHPVSSPVPMG